MAKNIVIVGASNGIGRAATERFLDSGYRVHGVDVEGPSVTHKNYTHYLTDLANSASVSELCLQLQTEKISDVVYCAAEQHIFPSTEPELALLGRMFTTNVASAWQIVAGLQHHLQMQGSALESVVFVSSVHALATSGSIAGYALTKAALSSLVRSLAIDLAPQRTRVNGVISGAVKTRMLTAHLSENDLQKLAARQLIDHIAEPQEIAKVIAFLVSDEASYITGQNVVADGGVLPLLATEVA